MKYDDLEAVNKEFNAYAYKSEVGDDWTPIDLSLDKAGDCDSYATAKAERLIKMGWPRSALRMGICSVNRLNRYGDHLILLADFQGQTWCLDNRYPYPMEYQQLSYAWKKFGHLDTGKWELA